MSDISEQHEYEEEYEYSSASEDEQGFEVTNEGIPEEADNDASNGFFGHTGALFAVDVSTSSKTPYLVCSGGEEGVGILHLFDTNDVIAHLEGPTDSINIIKFSPDGARVAMASMDGNVYIYDVPEITEDYEAESILLNPTFIASGPEDELEWMTWHPSSKALACGGADSLAWVFTVLTDKVSVYRAFSGHTGAIITGKFSPNGKLLITGGADGAMYKWTIAEDSGVKLIGHELAGNEYPLITALCIPTDNIAIVGTDDGQLILVNLSTMKKVSSFNTNLISTIENVEYDTTTNKFIAADVDGNFCVIDPTNATVVGSGNYEEGGITALTTRYGKFIACCTDGSVLLGDVRAASIETTYVGHRDMAVSLATTCDVLKYPFVITAGEDGAVYVFNLNAKY